MIQIITLLVQILIENPEYTNFAVIFIENLLEFYSKSVFIFTLGIIFSF